MKFSSHVELPRVPLHTEHKCGASGTFSRTFRYFITRVSIIVRSCQQILAYPNFSRFFLFVSYLAGILHGFVELLFFALNSMVFAILWCICGVFDLFLFLESALKPNFLEFCPYAGALKTIFGGIVEMGVFMQNCTLVNVVTAMDWKVFLFFSLDVWLYFLRFLCAYVSNTNIDSLSLKKQSHGRCRFVGRRRVKRIVRRRGSRKNRVGKQAALRYCFTSFVTLCAFIIRAFICMIIRVVVGIWQWPMRGVCIGEASHPGPPTPATQSDNRRSQPSLNRNCWAQLDGIDLENGLRKRVPTIRDPPRWYRGSLRRAYMVSLHEWRRNKSARA